MRRLLRDVALLLLILCGIAGVGLKTAPAMPSETTLIFFAPEIAEPAETVSLSNRGPYRAVRYVARNCLGEIWVLPLHRNGEAADLLPGAQGIVLDGEITREFPAGAYTLERLRAFAGLRTASPQVVAFAERGSCGLAGQIGGTAGE